MENADANDRLTELNAQFALEDFNRRSKLVEIAKKEWPVWADRLIGLACLPIFFGVGLITKNQEYSVISLLIFSVVILIHRATFAERRLNAVVKLLEIDKYRRVNS